MPNITVNVSEGDYRAARVWAAARGTTVSAVVRQVLQNLPCKQEDLPALVSSLAQETSRPESYLDLCLLPLERLRSGLPLEPENSATGLNERNASQPRNSAIPPSRTRRRFRKSSTPTSLPPVPQPHSPTVGGKPDFLRTLRAAGTDRSFREKGRP